MNIKKISTSIMAIALTVASLAGCGGGGTGGGGGGALDSSKSTLNVGVFKAGVGTTWLTNSIEAFEAYYANTSFEDNKMGIQVVPEEKTEEFKASNLSSTMPYNENAIYFLEQSDYEIFLAKNLLADITDTITEKVYDDNGDLVADKTKATKSILDTMNDEFVGYHEREGKYYAIPFRTHVSGIVYDADLFNENKYYFFADGTMGATQADIDKGASGNIGTGPDGVVGTADDGMPVTYNDFINLIKKMANEDEIIPFTWAGSTSYQRMYAYDSIWANYQGLNDYSLNWTFSGTTTDGQEVNESNFKDVLVDQEGRKAAIKFFYDIMNNSKYYSANAANNGHTQAQFEYIDSINQTKRIAMFMEGGYWENEARTYFDTAAIVDSNMGYGKRDFRIMPIPNFVGTTGIANQTEASTKENEVFVGRQNDSMICLARTTAASNSELQLKLAKLFLQFVQSREQLSNFVRDTGACFRTYEFNATEAELANWTKYGQSIYRYMEEGSRIVPDLSRSTARMDIYAKSEYYWSFAYQGNVTMFNPVDVFTQYPNLSVEDCFTNVKVRLRAV